MEAVGWPRAAERANDAFGGRAVRIGAETAVSHVDNDIERARRKVGRPSKAEPHLGFVVTLLGKEPDLMSLEILRRARLDGYEGGKSALYELIHSIRLELLQELPEAPHVQARTHR